MVMALLPVLELLHPGGMAIDGRQYFQIVQSYRAKAGVKQPIHPHLFRHQMLTYLTSKGLTDAQIQLISGHESKKSLEIYQHLSLESVDKAYQDAVQNVGV